jgi:hypothetical protein
MVILQTTMHKNKICGLLDFPQVPASTNPSRYSPPRQEQPPLNGSPEMVREYMKMEIIVFSHTLNAERSKKLCRGLVTIMQAVLHTANTEPLLQVLIYSTFKVYESNLQPGSRKQAPLVCAWRIDAGRAEQAVQILRIDSSPLGERADPPEDTYTLDPLKD